MKKLKVYVEPGCLISFTCPILFYCIYFSFLFFVLYFTFTLHLLIVV